MDAFFKNRLSRIGILYSFNNICVYKNIHTLRIDIFLISSHTGDNNSHSERKGNSIRAFNQVMPRPLNGVHS